MTERSHQRSCLGGMNVPVSTGQGNLEVEEKLWSIL